MWPAKNETEGIIPFGARWMPDTFNALDAYSNKFDKTPTVFFDPSSTSTYSRGTYYHPYKTAAQLNTWIAMRLAKNGNLAGQVIGFKRGSTLRGGMEIPQICGSAVDLVYLTPYGNAEALPIISGGTIYSNTGSAATGWESVGSGVYKLAIATEPDVYDQTYAVDDYSIGRMWKVAPGASEALTVAAVVAAGVGSSSYYSGNLYIYPFAGEPDWAKVEVGNALSALSVKYSNTSASGYITVAGLHVRCSRDSALVITRPPTYATISTVADINVFGCKSGQAGYDNAASTAGSDAIVVYGVSDAIRLTNTKILGNYGYDSLNNTVEIANVTGGEIGWNRAYKIAGPQIAELWSSCSDVAVHDCYGYGRYNQHTPLKAYGNRGIWCPGYDTTGGSTKDASKSTGNKYYRNVAINLASAGIEHCGAVGVAYNNTLQNNYSGGTGTLTLQDDATTHTCAITAKNNMFIGLGGGGANNVNAIDANITMTLLNNLYVKSTGAISVNYRGTTYSTLGTVQASVDAAAVNSAITLTSMGSATVTTAISNAGVAVAGYSEIDADGAVHSTANPWIGAKYS